MRHLSIPALAALAAILAPAASAQSLGGFGRPTQPAGPVSGPAGASGRPVQSSQGSPQFPQRQIIPQSPGGGMGWSPFRPSQPSQGTVNQPSGPQNYNRPIFTEPGDSYRPVITEQQSYRPGYQAYNNTNSNAPVYDSRAGQQSIRVTTPVGPQRLRNNDNYPIYGDQGYRNDYNNVQIIGGPELLGGYYYGGYTQTYTTQNCYPSVYSGYTGFPQYIYSPASVIIVTDPYIPVYVTGYQPFYTPSYPVVYNENIYYVGSEQRAQEIVTGDAKTRSAAISTAYPEGSFQAAFGDIERAWLDSSVAPLSKHLRGDDVKISVFFKGKYSYSIASSDYEQITRDAFDRLSTVSFKFNRLRKAKNGDVTAYGTHVYRAATDTAGDTGTVPFSTDGPVGYDNTTDAVPGVEKMINVSYTLHHQGAQWNIIAIDSTPAETGK